MPAPRIHPMMPLSSHDEASEQGFVVALKTFLYTQMDPALRRMTLGVAEEIKEQGDKPSLQKLRKRLEDKQLYQNWISSTRAAQEMMWQSAVDCVDRQRGELEDLEWPRRRSARCASTRTSRCRATSPPATST